MKFEKLAAFCAALKKAYKEVNADREFAKNCLESAELFVERYKHLTNLCNVLSEGMQSVYDQLDGPSWVRGTIINARSCLDTYITIQQVPDTDGECSRKYLGTYDVTKGEAFSGMRGMFCDLQYDAKIHRDLIRRKVLERNYTGAVQQYIALKKEAVSKLERWGLVMFPFITDKELEKYKLKE